LRVFDLSSLELHYFKLFLPLFSHYGVIRTGEERLVVVPSPS
jgi:hypothetical protein